MADGPHERTKRLGHRVDAKVPTSTYRLQLTPDFTFADAAARLDYFARLGVSHLYLSPILTAAPGSTHFYDVVDHSRISEALGGEEGLRALAWKAGEHGIGLVADLVPNHMAVPTPAYHNRALWSVLALGPDSPYAHWFDVDWSSGEPVLMPVLGQRLGSILASDELQLDRMIVPGFEHEGEVPVLRYYEHVFPVKEGTENLPMASLVDEQSYRLAYWRVGNEELNYRRFFDVGSLVAVRVEDPDVFDQTHHVIVDLVKDGTLDGLRIDHPDGLADPAGYIERLSEATDGAWIVVEKILEDDEQLPTSWKTAGTTGYDAAWRVGALMRDPAGAAPLAGTLYRLTGDALGSLPTLIQDAKREIVKESLSSEVHRLANLAHEVCTSDVRLRDHTWRALYDCIRRMLVAFNRYRAYVVPGTPPKPMSLEAIDHAAAKARELLDPERYETLDVVVDLLKGREVGSAGQTEGATRAELITRFQQACGAVMAKGVEDTAYYRWTHLLPLCEVGSPASRFALPPASFHAWAWDQQHNYPHAMTTLTTHDTKRSEDVRARLGVLSEVPDDWDALVGQLHAAVADRVPAQLDGRVENLWWQTLVGTSDETGMMEWERLSGYLTKAMREAKNHTTWTSIDADYEDAVQTFARAAHGDDQVAELIAQWHHDTAEGVRAAILGTKLIQLTMPGVPDCYQGNECVSPSLVDPDNRRPVDYTRRDAALAHLLKGGRPRSVSEEKLLVTARALRARRDHHDAYVGASAGYQALASSSGHAVVYARTVGDRPEVITVATRVALELERLGGWADATVQLPDGGWRDLIGKGEFDGGTVPLATLLRNHPVALLERAS
ncbi:malto-oligosyltrehalose synthase [Demequina capsici]|uniref:Malto-oligosyltrehalose synthase n=1 Tax=Demequina capsici TaxID=3075620 RepID=A0AA96J978_9MICO|nr:malto-oligosyltrehalose synthase [Demequina sp. OYTSA14]WNM25723.1 malto-oligosyltrehalose synthase [Demequina sp. OYTSA14]